MACSFWNISWPDFFFSNKKACCDPIIIFKCSFNFFYNSFLSILALKAGDIELNTGPNKNSHSYFFCCHWNVNSSPNHNCCKVPALKGYNFVYKYDFLCVSETCFNSPFESHDKDIMIEGYNLIHFIQVIPREVVLVFITKSL